MSLRTNNPVYNRVERYNQFEDGLTKASYKGIGYKTLFYILVTIVSAFFGIFLLYTMPNIMTYSIIGGSLLTIIFALCAMNIPKASFICGSLYCMFEGITIGIISYACEALYPGVVISAILGTISVVFAVAILYVTKLVKVTNKFIRVLFLFSIGFIICMILTWILSFIPAFNGILSAPRVVFLVEVLSLLLATLFLFFDINQAVRLVESGASKQLEWMVAFGITYTVLWIYVEILRIVVRIASENN